MTKTTLLRYSTIILVIALSFFIFWQVNSDRNNPAPSKLKPDQHDAYMIGAHYHSTDSQGNIHEQLSAEYGKHYPFNNSFELDSPELTVYGPHGEIWHIHANKGTSSHGSDTVILSERVQIEHRAKQDAPKVVVNTARLIVHPNDRTADTDAPVTITYPQVVLQGQGLHGDMKAGTLKLLREITGHYEPLTEPPHTIPVAKSESKLRAAL